MVFAMKWLAIYMKDGKGKEGKEGKNGTFLYEIHITHFELSQVSPFYVQVDNSFCIMYLGSLLGNLALKDFYFWVMLDFDIGFICFPYPLQAHQSEVVYFGTVINQLIGW